MADEVKLELPIADSKPVPGGDVEAGSESSSVDAATMTKDEAHLARMGYRQEFFRRLGIFESFASTFLAQNSMAGIPMLFGFAMLTGGPQAAFANWLLVGGFSVIVSLAMAEIAAAYPTAGGIYFWAYRLGGETWGPFLSWMTAWWNFAGWLCVIPGGLQGSTNFLLSALEVKYPDADVLSKGWFAWLMCCGVMVLAALPNVISQRVLQLFFRFAILINSTLFAVYMIWFPIRAAGNFQSRDGVFGTFFNGINLGEEIQASDSYCWVVGILFPAWVFYGYDTSAHLAEETKDAAIVVARGMWTSTLSAWLFSIPVSPLVLTMILFCIQDFEGIISATYHNTFAEYLVQLVGENGAVAVLALLYVDAVCATAACFISAQRVTFAISRDGVLPFSRYFRQLNSRKIPVNAAMLVSALSVALTTAVIGSTVALSAIIATATIATNFSYLIPIAARHTVGRKRFQPHEFTLGKFSLVVGVLACTYIMFLFTVLLLPELYPVTKETLNYAPICIGIVTIVSLFGWILPLGLGGKDWFAGPKRTIDDIDRGQSRTVWT
ncbi:amino acid or gaba permease [Podospora didyma]|uniref:Amino acid or gaba permease n=1 Tax=Podospora didyma TaxID=330526 RepID=A0AAE0N974_9PEZI|nr:amino acid or gaba permease [Podospora didyma]